MATIEMEVVNNSGELVTIYLTGVLDGNRVLQKQEIEALISASGGSDELVKADVSDPTAGYLYDKLVAGPGIALALDPDIAGNTVEISFDGASIPVGTTANQILQWTGTTWEARNYQTMIPSPTPPKNPNYFWLSSTTKTLRYTDPDEVTGGLTDDKGSPNGILHIWSGTQALYDAIITKDPETIYFIE